MDSEISKKNKFWLGLQERMLPKADRKKRVMTVTLDTQKKVQVPDEGRWEEFMNWINDSGKYTTRQIWSKWNKHKIKIYEVKK